MSYGWYDVVGNVGVLAILGSYLLMQLGRMDARGLAYSLLNAFGAALIVISLCFAFNASAMIVEVFWLAISLLGVARCGLAARARRRDAGWFTTVT